MTDREKLIKVLQYMGVGVRFHGQPAYFTAAGRRYYYDKTETIIKVEEIRP